MHSCYKIFPKTDLVRRNDEGTSEKNAQLKSHMYVGLKKIKPVSTTNRMTASFIYLVKRGLRKAHQPQTIRGALHDETVKNQPDNFKGWQRTDR